jgi:flagellar hook assembly protein FlgD
VVSPDGSSFPQTFSAFARAFTEVHNFPNPFRAGAELTSISYYLETDSKVTVRIYTLDGRPVYSKTYSVEEPEGQRGLRDIKWDGRNGDAEVVLNGIYICKLEAAGVDATFKIAVAK